MEVAMRAQREKVRLLQAGKADRDEIILHKAKYQGQLNEYSRFCRKMGLTEERGETPAEKIEALTAENAELKKTVDMLQGCILEMSELVYQ